jgi:hypothetical protein
MISGIVLLVLVVWVAAFFLKANREFTVEERVDLVRYGARRYILSWAVFGPERARQTLRSIVGERDFVESLVCDTDSASFQVVFSNGEAARVPLPALPDRAFLPWWALLIPPALWAGRIAWKRHRSRSS